MTQKTAEAPNASTETLSLTILQDKMHETLLTGGPKKTGELVAAINHPAVNLHIAKYALRTSPRFTQTQRKWDVSARWESPEVPFEQLIEGLLVAAGHPLSIEVVAQAISRILERDTESMEETVRRFVEGSTQFTGLDGTHVVLSRWILNTDEDKAGDVLFYNFMEPEEVEPHRKAAKGLDWEADPAAAAILAVRKSAAPIPLLALQFFAWEAQGRDLDALAMYRAIIEDEELSVTSTQCVYQKEKENSLLGGLKSLTASLGEEAEEEEEEAEDQPPAITDADLEETGRIIQSHTDTTLLSDVILQIYEIEQGERAYGAMEQTIAERLKHDPRFLWAGAGRFRPADSIPEHVHRIPDSLVIPDYDFATVEGERFDIEMEMAGLESGLTKEVHAPIVQDVGDEDPVEHAAKRPAHADCVLKYHHKQAGTYPLAQIPNGLLAAAPTLQEISLRSEGQEWKVWVNLDTRLISDMDAVYSALDMPISGGLFHLAATEKWDTFDMSYSGERDETADVQPGRLLEILQLKEEADSERLPTFEVMCRLLDHQSSGIGFPRLFIEVNLIRRVSRMLVASILSGYSCFSRQAKSGLWVFDEKKKDQGFLRSKRKYIVKES